jgi:hypothetical protein
MAEYTNALGQPVGAPVPGWRPPPYPSRAPMPTLLLTRSDVEPSG